MIKTMDLKQRLSISAIWGGISIVLFAIAVFGFLGTPFSGSLLFNYFFISLALSIYVFILLTKQWNIAFVMFGAGYIIAFFSMYYMFFHANDGFSDLAGIVLWLINMGLIVALGITVELLLKVNHSVKQYKQTHVETIDVEVIEPESLIDTDSKETE